MIVPEGPFQHIRASSLDQGVRQWISGFGELSVSCCCAVGVKLWRG